MAIFEIAKMEFYLKKFHEIDLFHFTSFFGLDFLNFLAYFEVWNTIRYWLDFFVHRRKINPQRQPVLSVEQVLHFLGFHLTYSGNRTFIGSFVSIFFGCIGTCQNNFSFFASFVLSNKKREIKLVLNSIFLILISDLHT